MNPAAAKKPKITPSPYSRAASKSSRTKRRSLGQINAGVSHKIRRPKPSRKVLGGRKLGKSFDSAFGTKQEVTPVKPVESTCKEPVTTPAAESRNRLVTPASNDEFSLLLQQNSTPKANSHSNERIKTVEKKPASVPKVITRNWNRERKETKERKFFKSRDSQESPNRIVTVSVSENLKYVLFTVLSNFQNYLLFILRLQIREKEPVTPTATRKSPRKLHRNIMETYKPIVACTPVVPSHSLNIDILHQDWNDDTEDISTNIQEILDGLSVEDTTDSPKKLDGFKIEEKENNTGVNKLFPLFNKNPVKSVPSLP